MHIVNIEKYFSELSTLPLNKQEEIVEHARYETFKTQAVLANGFATRQAR